VADVTLSPAPQSVSVAEQIRLVAGLRWRLLRNGLRKKNNRLDLIGMIIAGIFGTILIVGLSFAFRFGAETFVRDHHTSWLALLFWVIFVWCQAFPVFVAGFGATFEFHTLLRFPFSNVAFYLISLAYGLADFPSLAATCWLAAMTFGVTAEQPALLPAMLVVCVLFILLNVTLQRLVALWLERLLARRRSREVFFSVFILLMISLQFVTPLVSRYGSAARPWLSVLRSYLAPFPASLAGHAIASAGAGFIADSFTAIAGLSVYVFIFSAMLWRRLAAQYRGEELSESSAPVRRTVTRPSWPGTAADRLRLLPPQVAEVFRKELRYLMRNGLSFVLLFMPPLMIFLFTWQGGNRQGIPTVRGGSTMGFSRSSLFSVLMAYLVFVLMAPAYNCFAYEGRGVQTYFMVPIRFRQIFLGKNLLAVCIVGFEMILATLVFAFRVGLPPTPIFVATLAAVAFTVTGQLAIANWSSLSFPRKLQFAQMRGQRQSGMAVLVAFGAQITLGGISALLFFVGRWTRDAWLPAEAFVFLALAAIAGYVASLDPLSHLAEKKRETLIEALNK
jgi:ABC-2 type transport system permease protein